MRGIYRGEEAAGGAPNLTCAERVFPQKGWKMLFDCQKESLRKLHMD